MLKLLLIFALFFGVANAYEYRHKSTNRTVEDFYYVTIGIAFPLTNEIDDVTKLKLNISPISEIGQILDPATYNTSRPETFPSKKIGGSMNIGYKFPIFLRADIKIDFLTFSRKYQVTQQNFFFGETIREIDLTVRQTAFLANVYLDLDNPTMFTPYVGAGGGIAFTAGSFRAEINNSNFNEPENNMLSNPYLAYEFKTGIIIGSKKGFVDIEGFFRTTPELNLRTKGVIVKAGFRI